MDVTIIHLSHQAARNHFICEIIGGTIEGDGSFAVRYHSTCADHPTHQATHIVYSRCLYCRHRVNHAAHHEGTVDLAIVDIAEQAIVLALIAAVAKADVVDAKVGDQMTLAIVGPGK